MSVVMPCKTTTQINGMLLLGQDLRLMAVQTLDIFGVFLKFRLLPHMFLQVQSRCELNLQKRVGEAQRDSYFDDFEG